MKRAGDGPGHPSGAPLSVLPSISPPIHQDDTSSLVGRRHPVQPTIVHRQNLFPTSEQPIFVGRTNQAWNYDFKRSDAQGYGYAYGDGRTTIEFLNAAEKTMVMEASSVVVQSCDLDFTLYLDDSKHPSSIKVMSILGRERVGLCG